MNEPLNIEASEFTNLAVISPDFSDSIPLPSEGGMCDVEKVRIHNKWHFIKRLKPEHASHPLYRSYFEKEFDIAFQLDHQNIVRYLQKGFDKKGLYTIMEYVDGRSLRKMLQQHGKLEDKKLILKISTQLLEALIYIHKHQIYHLDIKPENVLLTHKGNNIKLIDFGLSLSAGYCAYSAGTEKHSSPEQFANPVKIDGRSDIYAFGKLLLELSTGDINRTEKQIPKAFRKIVGNCVTNEQSERFNSAEEILVAIKKLDEKRSYSKYVLIGSLFILGMYVALKVFNYRAEMAVKNPIVKPATNSLITPSIVEKQKQTVNKILAAYSDSTFSKNDSLQCVKMGNDEYSLFMMKYDSAIKSHGNIGNLVNLKNNTWEEVFKKWRNFSTKFNMGSIRYAKAERIFKKAVDNSDNKIDSIIYSKRVSNI